jgi:hypothetical protein
MKKILFFIGILGFINTYAQPGAVVDLDHPDLLGNHPSSYYQTKSSANTDSSRLAALTTRHINDSIRINFLYTDTAVVWNDTVKLTKNKVFAMKTLTGSKTLVQGTETLTGVTYEYWFKGTGNAYTISVPAAWKKIGTDTYDDILNKYYVVTVHKGSSGLICYVINKL